MLLVLFGVGVGLGVTLIAAAVWWMAWQRHAVETVHTGESASLDGEGVLAEFGDGEAEQPALDTERDVDGVDGAPAVTGRPAAANVEQEPNAHTAEEPEDSSDLPRRPRVWVQLLGAVRVEVDGVEARVPGRRLELLCYFLLHPDGVSLTRVVDAMWPDVQLGREPERSRTRCGG